MNLEIKESIRGLERDNIDIYSSLNDYDKSKSITVVNNVNLDKASMNVNQLLLYKDGIFKDLITTEDNVKMLRDQDEVLDTELIQAQ